MSEDMFAKALGAHGANPEKLYKALNIALPERILDFSTNASVVKWDNLDINKLDWLDLAAHYPDYECLELRKLIAQREDVNLENILFVNGSNEAFYIIASYLALANKRAFILQPAYSEYERALKSYSAECVDIYDLKQLENCDSAVFFSNPCNPTGKYIEPDCLLELIISRPDVLFVIDEAYVDFLLHGDRPKYDFNSLNNVIVLRSLTKFFHLSGLRIGYVLSSDSNINKLKSRQPTWSVNAPAQTLALEFLRDEDFALKSMNFYRQETPRFINALKSLGFNICDTRTNFFIIDLDNLSDEEFIIHMLKRGVVVRHTRNFKSLDGRYIRASTRLPDENDIFVAAARELVK